MSAPKTLLVLGAAAVQEDCVLVAKRLGIRTIVCAMAADGPAADAADEFHAINLLDVDALEALIKDKGVDCVYSTGSDLAMPVVGELSERLGLPTFVTRETARTCNDKGAMREATKGMPGAVPFQTFPAGAPVELGLDLPVIVKPVDAQGQRGVRLVTDAADVVEAVETARTFSRTGGAIAERFVGGTEVSVNGFLVGGELVACLVSDRVTWPQHTGLIWQHVLPSTVVDEACQGKIRALLASVAERVGLAEGPIYAQMKVEDGEPYIIEVTPRFDGCHMWRVIEIATGVNLLEATLRRLVLGEDVAVALPDEVKPTTLAFTCHIPGEPAPEQHGEPGDLEHRAYYAPGAMIRPVNGRYDKIGYRIVAGQGI